ncbi:MAG: ATP-binding protein [Nanobdellota archaeon]
MKKIVVLSGKGGVGKSSITASLAVSFSEDKKIACADCDVDASNLSLLFSLKETDYDEWIPLSTNYVAKINQEKCIKCGKCIDTCYFGSIYKYKGNFKVFEESCEGCGACELICPVKAIRLNKINNAFIGSAKTNYGFNISSAQLLPGNSGSGKVVSEVKKKAMNLEEYIELMITDSAAGIGCPVISSVSGNDFALIVTEPSLSGFSDMKKAIEVVDHFKMEKAIIINKSDINKKIVSDIKNYAYDNNIKIIGEFPYDKVFVKAMNSMIPVIEFSKKYKPIFKSLRDKIGEIIYER